VNILVSDIGGTKARFGIFKIKERVTLLAQTNLSTQDYEDLASIMHDLRNGLLKEHEIKVALIGIAGPILGNAAYPPHIAFGIDGNEVKRHLGVSEVVLVNDMLLHSYASLSPDQKSLQLVKKGHFQEGQRGIFAPGTGFGQCGLLKLKTGFYKAVLSEGGHSFFPFQPEENGYMKFLSEELKIEPTFDNVVSGPGLLRLYRFLRKETIPPQEIGDVLKADKEFRLWTAKLLGRASKHIALTYLSLGGLYISGGIVNKNPWILEEEIFLEEFLTSKTMSNLLEKIPIWLIKDEFATLWGGAYYFKFGHNI